MINLENFKNTLENISLDKINSQYMTNSKLEAIDFDEVKNEYINSLNLYKFPHSNDALFIDKENNMIFIEFKNGIISQTVNYELRLKIYESLLILLDIINENISFSREKISYILVYNEDKKHSSKFYDKTKREGIESIKNKISSLAKEEIVRFDLKQYEDIYFKKVSTYNKKEFEEKFIKKYEVK